MAFVAPAILIVPFQTTRGAVPSVPAGVEAVGPGVCANVESGAGHIRHCSAKTDATADGAVTEWPYYSIAFELERGPTPGSVVASATTVMVLCQGKVYAKWTWRSEPRRLALGGLTAADLLDVSIRTGGDDWQLVHLATWNV